MSPHQRMTELDKAGTAYWLENLILQGAEVTTPSGGVLPVIHHDDRWLCVQITKGPCWLNLDNVVAFVIVEGD